MECFRVYKNEIEGRLDCEFYKKRLKISKEVNKFETKILGDISVLKRGPFGGSIKKEIFVEKGENTYQVYEQYNAINNDLYRARYFISEKDYKRLESFAVMPNDIIMSCSGTIGKLAVIPNDFNKGVINQALLRIRLKSGFNINYFVIIFSLIIGKLIEGNEFAYGAAIRNIVSIDELKNIQIPLPPLEIQNKIVQLMDNAYSLKKSKESEAQKLLDSINDYVLDELGIKLPELKDKMCYAVDSSSIRGRVDPYYYQPNFEEIEKSIYQGKFEVKELKDSLKNDLIKGMLPSEEEKDGDIKVLQIKNILKNGLINTSEYVTAKNIFKSEHKIKKEEIIIVITGATIGKVGLWYSDEEFYLGGDMIKFSVNNRFNPYFIQAFLLSQAGQYQLMREITGATNKHLSPDNIKAIKVSLPPLEIQNKIAEEVKARMQKAKQLQEEAKSILEEAKEKVERIILGNEEI